MVRYDAVRADQRELDGLGVDRLHQRAHASEAVDDDQLDEVELACPHGLEALLAVAFRAVGDVVGLAGQGQDRVVGDGLGSAVLLNEPVVEAVQGLGKDVRRLQFLAHGAQLPGELRRRVLGEPPRLLTQHVAGGG